MPTTNAYETSDLGLASFLACEGLLIERLDKSNPRRVVFHFSDGVAAEQLAKQYWEGIARVPPLALFLAHRTLKQRLYNEQP